MLIAALYLHLFSTIFMTGLIWFVQVVHYPMFAFVGEESFNDYEKIHQQLTTYVVGPAMFCEAISAAYLVWRQPEHTSTSILWLGAVLIVVIWGVTALISVPLHEKLSSGFDASAHRVLVNTNWIRTIAWSLRAGIACLVLHQFLTFKHLLK